MKYQEVIQSKDPIKLAINERAAEATRPTVSDHETRDRLSLIGIVVMLSFAVALAGEQLLVAVGWLA